LAGVNQALERRVEERTAELRQKEQELLQAQKMEAIGQLAGGVAHDFNNLLTVILGSTELLMDRYPAGTPEREELREIFDAANRAVKLTGQLLAFGRKQIMQPRIIDLNEVLEGMREILDRMRGEDVDLVWKLSPELYPVKFDPGQIEQAVLNLVVNARDAMPRGGKLTIDTANVELDEDYVAEHKDAQLGPHAMLAVSDTGSGMTAEIRAKIFEPFFTTKQPGQGTGLGLSTTYGIVRQGGGNIWVYSEPGRGTTFKVYLPRAESAAALPRSALPVDDEAAVTGTVLVVEDQPRVRALILRVLSGAGFAVLEAESVSDAMRAHAEHDGHIDLLLTDVVLPDGNGPEVAAELTSLQPGLRVLFMSGYTNDAIFHRGLLEQDAAFIEKPVRPRLLVERVRALLAPGYVPIARGR
jgi:nitrogen-specific signal transduction histidine kinase